MANFSPLLLHKDNAGIAAFNCETKEQVLVSDPCRDEYNFFVDCLSLDQPTADVYDAGIPIYVAMRPDDWATWVAAYSYQPEHVWLSITREDLQINILSLTDRIELSVPFEELAALKADCFGWNQTAYLAEQTFVVRMALVDWVEWTNAYEPLAVA